MKDAALSGKLCRLRAYRPGDEDAMRAAANDFMVARWMTQRFPHPYTLQHAERWIEMTSSGRHAHHFAIEVDGVLVGGIGFDTYEGEGGGVASFGYWLGRAYWGRGIGTDAARTLADHALDAAGLRRLEARVFEENVASARVLLKIGFSLEGRLKAAYVDRYGKVCNALLFARVATT